MFVSGAALDRATAIEGLRHACARLLSVAPRPAGRTLDLLHETAIALHGFARAVGACEAAGLVRADLSTELQPVRALHSQSPFVHRLQQWPRGYAGDFETVEWLCDARNRAEPGTVPWAIEQCALQSPIAQQHRNKVSHQARAILGAVLARPDARILSVGCGGCRDLSLIQDYVPETAGTFVLVDQDDAALAFARERLQRLAGRSHLVQGRVPRVLTQVRALGPFDLVVAGGLFDYLPDRWAVATLTAMRGLLAPTGRVLLSNIACGNPFRPWIEYLADWFLIERSDADVRGLLDAAGYDAAQARVSRDSTGLALLAEAEAAIETPRV